MAPRFTPIATRNANGNAQPDAKRPKHSAFLKIFRDDSMFRTAGNGYSQPAGPQETAYRPQPAR